MAAPRGGGGRGAIAPLWFSILILILIFFVVEFLLVSSAVGHRHDNTPTPLWKFCGKIFEVGEKKCVEVTPRWATFSGLAQIFWARAAVAIHFAPPPPPPKQTPWRRPWVKLVQVWCLNSFLVQTHWWIGGGGGTLITTGHKSVPSFQMYRNTYIIENQIKSNQIKVLWIKPR